MVATSLFIPLSFSYPPSRVFDVPPNLYQEKSKEQVCYCPDLGMGAGGVVGKFNGGGLCTFGVGGLCTFGVRFRNSLNLKWKTGHEVKLIAASSLSDSPESRCLALKSYGSIY